MQYSSFKSFVLASVLAAPGFAAFAQTASPDAASAPAAAASAAAQSHHGMGMHGKMDPAKMKAMMAKRHAALKAKLKLTPEQEGAWTTFTAAMAPPARTDHPKIDRAEMAKLTTPERIDKMHAIRTQHLADMSAAMDKRDEAIKTFYAALNDDQKKIFDAEHNRMGSRHGEHHRSGKGASDKPAGK